MVSNDLGGQWTDDVSARYTIGPELDIGLPLGFGIEADGLYRHESYEVPEFTNSTVWGRDSWEFPILLKKYLPFPVVKPFVEGGWVPRDVVSQTFSQHTSQGLAIGGGIRIGIGRLHLSPVLRYTHWNNSLSLLSIPNGPEISLSSNQMDLLVGVSWRLH